MQDTKFIDLENILYWSLTTHVNSLEQFTTHIIGETYFNTTHTVFYTKKNFYSFFAKFSIIKYFITDV